jgi:hypothetical protein
MLGAVPESCASVFFSKMFLGGTLLCVSSFLRFAGYSWSELLVVCHDRLLGALSFLTKFSDKIFLLAIVPANAAKGL